MTQIKLSNLSELLLGRLAARPDRPFLDVPGGVMTHCGELCEQSDRFAAALREAGISSGDRVAARTPRCPDAVALYLACLRVGAVYLPLNDTYGQEETARLLDDAEPRLLVCEPQAPVDWTGDTLTLGAGGDGSLADLARGQAR